MNLTAVFIKEGTIKLCVVCCNNGYIIGLSFMFIRTEALWGTVCWCTRITSTGLQWVPLCPRMAKKCHFSGILSTCFWGKEKQEYSFRWCSRCFKVFLKDKITLLAKLGMLWNFRNAKRNVQARFELAKKVLDLKHVGEVCDTGFWPEFYGLLFVWCLFCL